MVKKNIILLSYGNTTEYFRAIFCVCSLPAWLDSNMENVGIIIYTDSPAFFQSYLSGFNIEYSYLSPELISDIRGEAGYMHHIKVATVDMTFERHPGEDLIFIDSDTFFYANPKALFEPYGEGTSYMHKREYTLEDGLRQYQSFGQGNYPRDFIDYLSGRELLVGGQPEVYSADDYSWNSGVLGLQHQFAAYMPDIKRFTSEFFLHSKWFVSEQLAFSLILQRRTTIKPADGFVYHYWGKRQKVLVDKLIVKLIEKNRSDLFNQSKMKTITRRWKRLVEIDLIAEQIQLAYAQGSYFYATKQTVKLILSKIFM